jgi:hypothetical protein
MACKWYEAERDRRSFEMDGVPREQNGSRKEKRTVRREDKLFRPEKIGRQGMKQVADEAAKGGGARAEAGQ